MPRLSFGSLRQWHWISSALCLAGLLLFSVTGVTLNHAGDIESRARVTRQQGQLPEPLAQNLLAISPEKPTTLPQSLQTWLETHLHLNLRNRPLEWSAGELYIGLPRPGGDAWLTLDVKSGELEYEDSERGWIAYFNDLHKGRHTGAFWRAFIDVLGVCAALCSVTGLWLLARQARQRLSTWPVAALGLLVPLLIILLFLH